MPESDSLELRGRWRIHVNLYLVVILIVIVSELIGTHKIPLGPGLVVLLPMLYAVVIGIALSPLLLGKVLPALKKVISKDEIELASSVVMIALLPLGVKYGTNVGPAVYTVIKAGPALLLQELGNVFTVPVGMSVALLLGVGRESVGATLSICRESALGVIGGRYGLDSPEGIGVLGTYITGTVFGTIFFGLLGSLSVLTGLHPYALAMACGVGSASMMSSSSASLAATVPAMKETILAYAATSNLLTGIDGVYSELFLGLPIANWMYRKLSPHLHRKKELEQ